MKTPTKLLWSFLGAAVGGGVGYLFSDEENKVKNALIGFGVGGLGTLGVAHLADLMPTHVNYTLHHKNKRVYDGISVEERLTTRINEHKNDGKVFDTVIVSLPKPKSEALDLEKYRIKRFNPPYNVHNNG